MGIEPFLVASSVNCIVAQRLARRICPECNEPDDRGHDRGSLVEAGLQRRRGQGVTLLQGSGCGNCSDTGFKGRDRVYEVMELTEELKEFVLNGASAMELKREAIRGGMATLRRSVLKQAARRRRRSAKSPRVDVGQLGVPRRGSSDRWPTCTSLLKAMIEKGASDLHITTNRSPPQLRIDGKLHPLKMPPLSPPETKQLCYSVLTDAQKHRFEETRASSTSPLA